MSTIEKDYKKLSQYFAIDKVKNRPKTAFKNAIQIPVNILHNIDIKKLPGLHHFFMITRLYAKNTCLDVKNELTINGSNKKKGEKQRILSIKFNKSQESISISSISSNCKFFFIPLSLHNYGGSSHANLLIFDTSTKILEHFEPWGGESGPVGLFDKQDYEKIKKIVEKEYNIHISQIKTSSDTCPALGIQSFENRSGKDTKLDLEGYCHYWGEIFLEAKLRNPTLSSKKIQNLIIEEIKQLKIDPRVYVRDYIIYNYTIIYRVLRVIYDFFPKLRKISTYIVTIKYCDLIQCIIDSDCFRSKTLYNIIDRYNIPNVEFKKKFKNINIMIDVNSKKLQYISGSFGPTVPFITITSKHPFKYTLSEYGTEQDVLNKFQHNMLNKFFPINDINCLLGEEKLH